MKVSEAIEKLTVKRDDALHFQKLYRAGDVGWSANESKAIAYSTAINVLQQIDEPQAEKVEVPDFVAEWFEIHKDELEYHVWRLIIKSNEDYADYESDKTDMRYWIQYAPYHPIETLLRMKDGYTVKQKRWVVKSKDHIGLESFVTNTILPVWTTEEPLWMTFTDKSKAEAVATLVEGSVEEV